MLGYSKIDINISDINVKTAEFIEYKGILRINRVTNSILAIMYSKP